VKASEKSLLLLLRMVLLVLLGLNGSDGVVGRRGSRGDEVGGSHRRDREREGRRRLLTEEEGGKGEARGVGRREDDGWRERSFFGRGEGVGVCADREEGDVRF